MKTYLSLVFPLLLLMACSKNDATGQSNKAQQEEHGVEAISDYIKGRNVANYEVATLAGGCFWCTEAALDRIKGVVEVFSGYAGGEKEYPTYSEVSNKLTKHAESIQVYYDPEVVTYEQLLKVFFVAHDPTQLNRQGNDIGPQYRSAIFYHDQEQKQMAEKVMAELEKSGKFSKPIVTELNPYEEFWVAEGYHQNYYELNPGNPYVRNVSQPKVEKVMKTFKDWLKPEFQQ